MPNTKAEAAEAIPELVTLTQSPEGLPAIEMRHVTEDMRSAVLRVMRANRLGDPDYEMRQKVGAFLQSNSGNYMLIEFWNGTPQEHQEFVDYLNKKLTEDTTRPR